MTKTRLIGLSGSLRTNATNSRLLREAARLYGDADYTQADLNLPLYNGDDEDRDGVPAQVDALAQAIVDADGVLISTPEYNGGISGVLKNALDWISRSKIKPWQGKPVAIMSAAAGRSGGALGQEMLRACLVNFRPRLALGPKIMLADSGNQFDENGHLIADWYQRDLTAMMDALKSEIAARG